VDSNLPIRQSSILDWPQPIDFPAGLLYRQVHAASAQELAAISAFASHRALKVIEHLSRQSTSFHPLTGFHAVSGLLFRPATNRDKSLELAPFCDWKTVAS
jgi:hypothetical protein